MTKPVSPVPGLVLPDALVQPVLASLSALPPGAGVGVAVSGGPDSVALAVVAAAVARTQGRAVHLLHVHHGLLDQADAWAEGVARMAQALGVPFAVRHVQVSRDTGEGLEAAARASRYAGLVDMAREAGLVDILLAHHLDDQAETVVIRLLRGAGPTGMSAMRARRSRDGVCYHRPWLAIERCAIAVLAQAVTRTLELPMAEDPSNQDRRHARGMLRTDVLPALAAHWPGYRQTLARFARHSAEAAAVMDEVASMDVAALGRTHPRYGATLDLAGWRALSPTRRALALRRWLANAGDPMPSEARLDQICHQMATAAQDRQLLLQHGDVRLRVFRGQILREVPAATGPGGEGAAGGEPPPSLVWDPAAATLGVAAFEEVFDTPLAWSGERSVPVPALGGTLWLEPAESGVDPAWLAGGALRIGMRRGRERLRVAPDRPSRSLKNLYQEAGIPAWERPRLPLLWRGATLVFASGLGLDARVPHVPGGLQLRWRSDAPGATEGHGHDNDPPNAG